MKHIPKDCIYHIEWQVLRIFDWDGTMLWNSTLHKTPIRAVSILAVGLHPKMNKDNV